MEAFDRGVAGEQMGYGCRLVLREVCADGCEEREHTEKQQGRRPGFSPGHRPAPLCPEEDLNLHSLKAATSTSS